jgi:large subunit ribosomal protein L21e
MKKTRGSRTGTRYKLKRNIRERGNLPVTRSIQKFERGERVHIVIEPSIQKGQPHPRFHGRTGTIVEKRGRSYLVEVTEGNAKKLVISAPVHLRPQGESK